MSALLLSVALLAPSPIEGQEPGIPTSSSDPLAPFERLVGGEWHLDGSVQEFDWGVGARSIVARGYSEVDGERRLVSEGVWFWHPGEQRIKGFVTAIGMPAVLFDYTTRFEGDTMVNHLRAYTQEGEEEVFVERWEFTDDEHYVWTLLQETPDGLQEVMSGTYSRR